MVVKGVLEGGRKGAGGGEREEEEVSVVEGAPSKADKIAFHVRDGGVEVDAPGVLDIGGVMGDVDDEVGREGRSREGVFLCSSAGSGDKGRG